MTIFDNLIEISRNNNLLHTRFVPFQQEKPQCFAESAAWLKWFLTAEFQTVALGNYAPVIEPSLLTSIQPNAPFYHYNQAGYHMDLQDRLSQLSLQLTYPKSIQVSNTISGAVHFSNPQYNEDIGMLIFANDNKATRDNPGHVMSFGLRRNPDTPEIALFAFFDPNVGMIIIALNHFPPFPFGTHEELNEIEETRYPVYNRDAYNKSIHLMETFFKSINDEYTFTTYHGDAVRCKGDMVLFSSRSWENKNNQLHRPNIICPLRT